MDLLQRAGLTFEQAEGAAPLPTQLQLQTIDSSTISALWAIFNRWLDQSKNPGNGDRIYGSVASILCDFHVYHEHKFIDEWSSYRETRKKELKALFKTGSYTKIFGFVQFSIRHRDAHPSLADQVQSVLVSCRSAYRVLDGNTIAPFASEEEAEALTQAVMDVSSANHLGAKTHLKNAAALLTEGNFADSARESIHAVDAVARRLAPNTRDLGPALTALEKNGYIHTAMRQAFSSLYGYTSNEKGIRHALIDEASANVSETDALFMLGACAAFVSYLTRRGLEVTSATQ